MSDSNDIRRAEGTRNADDELSLHSDEEEETFPFPEDKQFNQFYADAKLNERNTPIKPKKPLWRELWSHIRPYYFLDHLTWKDTKVILTSWVQIFAGVVLTAIHPVLAWLGNAPYLLQIFGFFTAAGGVLTTGTLYLQMSIFMGFIYLWLFAVITMKINNRLQGYMTMEQLVENLIKEGTCQPGPDIKVCVMEQVYSGRYLNAKVAAVSSITIITGKVFFGLLTQKGFFRKPVYIGGAIGIIIQVCFGVFWPVFDPITIAMVLLKPVGISCVLGVLVSFLMWPQTASHQYVNGHLGVLKLLRMENANHIRFFKTMRPSLSSFLNYKNLKNNVHKTRNKANPLRLLLAILRYEVSYSRFDLNDLSRVSYFARSLISVTGGYDHFYELFQERKDWAALANGQTLSRRSTIASAASGSNASQSHGGAKLFTTLYDLYKKVGEFEDRKRTHLLRQRIDNLEFYYHLSCMDLDSLAEILIKHCAPCLEVTDLAFEAICSWITDANSCRFYSIFHGDEHKAKREKNNATLRNVKEKIEAELARVQDQEILTNLLHEVHDNDDALVFMVSQMAIFIYLLRTQSLKLIDFIDFMLELDERRPQPQIISYFTTWRKKNPKNDDAEKYAHVFADKIQQRNPDSEVPSHYYQMFGMYFARVYRVLLHHTLWFFIRSGGFAVITAIPYFVRSTAHWYYHNRFVWIVIMCMMTDTELTGDSIYSFCWKLTATFVGAIVGMVSWYICQGNAYGFAAVSGVVYLFCIYFRHFSVHTTLLPCIMIGISSSLVLATSYVDHIRVVLTDIGSGFRVAWLRFVSVIIGLSIGFLPCLFPRPYTSTVVNRKKMANLITQLGEIHCLVARFTGHRLKDPDLKISSYNFVQDKFNKAFADLAGVNALMGTLKHEIPLQGDWPEALYRKLQSHIYDVTQLYFLLLSLVNQVENPGAWNPVIMRRMGWTSSSVQAIFFAITHMSADSLLTKNGLPKVTASNLSMRHYEMLTLQWNSNSIGPENQELGEALHEEATEKDALMEDWGGEANVSSDHSSSRGNDSSYKGDRSSSGGDAGSYRKEGEQDERLSNDAESAASDVTSLDSSAMIADNNDPVAFTGEEYQLRKESSKIHHSMISNLDFNRVFSHDGQLTTTSLLLAHLIYQRMDQIMLVVKLLVGEKFDIDVSLLEDIYYDGSVKSEDI